MDGSQAELGDVEALGFDVYGTLIDVAGVAAKLSEEFGADRGRALAVRWREKQLEYSFRRGLMDRHADFGVCTRHALLWVCAEAGLECPPDVEERLMGAFFGLPAFDDAAPALEALKGGGRRLYAFSNGTREQVEAALDGAGIRDAFEDVVSVEEVSVFKPSPKVYAHFVARAGVGAPGRALLVSSNMFDVIGAAAAGMATAWINRGGLPFEPWEFRPTAEFKSLEDLPAALG